MGPIRKETKEEAVAKQGGQPSASRPTATKNPKQNPPRYTLSGPVITRGEHQLRQYVLASCGSFGGMIGLSLEADRLSRARKSNLKPAYCLYRPRKQSRLSMAPPLKDNAESTHSQSSWSTYSGPQFRAEAIGASGLHGLAPCE